MFVVYVHLFGSGLQRELDCLERSLSAAAGRLAAERDRIVSAARLPRHGVLLDLALGGGLLTFELLLRRA